MENKDVRDLLDHLRIKLPSKSSLPADFTAADVLFAKRDDAISRLMNLTLQCLGAIRELVIENEKHRISLDCTDIDGAQRDSGTAERVQRQVFAYAANTMIDRLLSGREIDITDPVKPLLESFPWSYTFAFLYAIRSQSTAVLEELIRFHPHGVQLPDGKGKTALHYACATAKNVQTLLILAEAAQKPLEELCKSLYDDYGNLPLHIASSGLLSPSSIQKEILYSYPEAVKIANNDGQFPLHCAASGHDVEKIKNLLSAFPAAISIPDKRGLLPLHQAALTSKSVEVIKYLYESYPGAISNTMLINGRLPLHYATVKCLSARVIEYLITLYPEACKIYDVNQRLPLHNLIARSEYMTPSRLKCLRLLLEIFPKAVGMSDRAGRTPIDIARRDGHGDLVMRLLLRADPSVDPEALGELAYLASKAKFRQQRRLQQQQQNQQQFHSNNSLEDSNQSGTYGSSTYHTAEASQSQSQSSSYPSYSRQSNDLRSLVEYDDYDYEGSQYTRDNEEGEGSAYSSSNRRRRKQRESDQMTDREREQKGGPLQGGGRRTDNGSTIVGSNCYYTYDDLAEGSAMTGSFQQDDEDDLYIPNDDGEDDGEDEIEAKRIDSDRKEEKSNLS